MTHSKRSTSPARVILLGFVGVIVLGTLLLSLPVSSVDGVWTHPLDAAFTATSATCVTGLIVLDTATHWSPFGQFVLLLLIQIGGMGVVTLALAVALVSGRRIGLRQRHLMQESISAPQMGGIVRVTGFLLRGILLFECFGAALLCIRFIPLYGIGKGIWYAIFHAISAFCNAGFDLMGVQTPFSSLAAFSDDVLINVVVMLLITAGGLGFLVWDDLLRNRLHIVRWRLQTKLVLVTSALLIVVPAFFFYLHEFRGWAELSATGKVLASLFQSVTCRTAGFNSVDLAAMQPPEQLVMILLMLVGGSPGSTAGGFKTTSLAVTFLCVAATLRSRESVEAFGRRVSRDAIRAAITLLFLYLVLFLLSGIVICCIEDIPLLAALFESASAIGTVGLTLGYTAGFRAVTKWLLMALMLFGRVGGLTMLYALGSGLHQTQSPYPEESIAIG